MWQVDNRTPFAAERGWVRGRDGTEIWLVAVKATFYILPDGSTEVTYRLAVDISIPMIGMLKRKAEKVIIDTALKGLKKRVESIDRP